MAGMLLFIFYNKKLAFELTYQSTQDWSVLLWVCCMTANLYFNVVASRATDAWEKKYHAVAWGLPLAIAIVPFMAHQYGPAGAWWCVDLSGCRWL